MNYIEFKVKKIKYQFKTAKPYFFPTHFGWGGNGIGGSFIYGIGLIKSGLGGGSWDGFIPPFAKGKSAIAGICCLKLSMGTVLGWL